MESCGRRRPVLFEIPIAATSHDRTTTRGGCYPFSGTRGVWSGQSCAKFLHVADTPDYYMCLPAWQVRYIFLLIHELGLFRSTEQLSPWPRFWGDPTGHLARASSDHIHRVSCYPAGRFRQSHEARFRAECVALNCPPCKRTVPSIIRPRL